MSKVGAVGAAAAEEVVGKDIGNVRRGAAVSRGGAVAGEDVGYILSMKRGVGIEGE